jgi:hypothetical protein
VRVVFEHGPRCAGEETQEGPEHVQLEYGVAGRAERTSELKGHPEGARRLDLLRMLADEADPSRGDACNLDVV